MGTSPHKIENYFTGTLQVRCPPTLPAAIEQAAAANAMTMSAYVRQSILERLKADGVHIQSVSDEAVMGKHRTVELMAQYRLGPRSAGAQDNCASGVFIRSSSAGEFWQPLKAAGNLCSP